MTDQSRQNRGKRAFTLIELLAVLVIISILATATLPALKGTLDGINVSGAADLAGSELSLARQMAISRNLPVEVRIYSSDDGTGNAYRILALVIPTTVTGAAEDEWITAGKILPGNVLLDTTGEFSTLISKANTLVAADPKAPWKTTESTDAPRLLQGKDYVAFQFNPDGSTNLPTVDASNLPQAWCITLKGLRSKPQGTAPAANYVSIVLDSLTGRSLVYQP